MNLPNNQRCVTICGNRRMEFEWTLLGAIATCTAEDTNIELIQIADLTPPWRSCLLFAFKSAFFLSLEVHNQAQRCHLPWSRCDNHRHNHSTMATRQVAATPLSPHSAASPLWTRRCRGEVATTGEPRQYRCQLWKRTTSSPPLTATGTRWTPSRLGRKSWSVM